MVGETEELGGLRTAQRISDASSGEPSSLLDKVCKQPKRSLDAVVTGGPAEGNPVGRLGEGVVLYAGFVLPPGLPAAYPIEATLFEPGLDGTISRHSVPR